MDDFDDIDDFVEFEEVPAEDAEDIMAHIDVEDQLYEEDSPTLYFNHLIKGSREVICMMVWNHCDGWGCATNKQFVLSQCNKALDKIIAHGEHKGFIFIKILFDDDEFEKMEKSIRFQVDIQDDKKIIVGDKVRSIVDTVIFKRGETLKVKDVREDANNISVEVEGKPGHWPVTYFEKIQPPQEDAESFLDSIATDL
jgi:hypothetical protein